MASVLETFMIMFDSDASAVKKGADEAEKSTDNLKNKLNQTNDISTKIGAGFKDMIKGAAGVLVSVAGIGALIAGFSSAVNLADILNENSQALDISVEKLGLWGQAVKLSGGTVEGFIGSVSNLALGLTQLDVVGKSRLKPFFDELGISLKDTKGNVRDVMDILPELADKFEHMSKQESMSFGRKLGLDDGTIKLLQQGRKAVDELLAKQKEYGVITGKTAAEADKYKDSIDEFSYAFKVFAANLSATFLPAITAAFEGMASFFGWLNKNKTFVLTTLTALAIVLGALAAPALAAAAPFLLIAAAVTAAILAYGLLWEDLYNWSSGIDSVTGRIIESLKKIPAYLKNLAEEIAGGVKNIFTGYIEAILAAISDLILKVAQPLENFFSKIGFDNVFGDMGTLEALRNGRDQLAVAGSTPLNSQTSNSIMNGARNFTNSTNVTVGAVTVNTQATDANGIATAINSSLQQQISQATNNFDDGVSH